MRFKPISTALHLALAAAVVLGAGFKAPWLALGLLAASGLILVFVIARVFLRN